MNSPSETLRDKIARLPHEPGVYIMRDSKSRVLYVGKAKNLRNRVASYFARESSLSLKTRALVERIVDVEVVIVASEVEALLLERNLIRHESPQFNVLLRDDKEYPLLRIDRTKPWARLEKVRRRNNDEATYLGPFGSGTNLNLVVAAMHKIFPLVRCSEHEFRTAKRPCNYYAMGRCLGPCTLPVERAVYERMLDDVVGVLEGKRSVVAEKLRESMNTAAAAERYEEAAFYRDQLAALQELVATEQVIDSGSLKEADAIGIWLQSGEAMVQVMMVRNHRLRQRDAFFVKAPLQTEKELLAAFLLQYYHGKEPPAVVLLPYPVDNPRELATALGMKANVLRTPHQGDGGRLVAMAQRNARHAFEEAVAALAGDGSQTAKALEQLAALLDIDAPQRIECMDISHFQGTATVASIVSFLGGLPDKSAYRRYKLAEMDHPDDFESIRMVMRRRLRRGRDKGDLPDLLIIDGGAGQLSAALEVWDQEFETLARVPVVALAKSRREAGHDETIRSPERLFVRGRKAPLALEEGSPSYRLVTHLRNEAHRFAITYHRKRRRVERQSSRLEDCEGIGPTLRRRLLHQFGSLENIAAASKEALCSVPGMTAAKAERLAVFTRHLLDDPTTLATPACKPN